MVGLGIERVRSTTYFSRAFHGTHLEFWFEATMLTSRLASEVHTGLEGRSRDFCSCFSL